MTTLSNETEIALSQLAEELGIPVEWGWKSRLAERLGVKLRVISKWINRNKIPGYFAEKVKSEGIAPENWPLLPDDIVMGNISQKTPHTPSEPRESTKSPRPILTGTVHRERRSPWHSDPRKNELLRMAAYILEVDDPEITPAFEQEIIEAHNKLVRGLPREPEPKKALNHT